MAINLTLSQKHFNNIIRSINRSNVATAGSIETATKNALERLGVERDVSKAVTSLPKGSDQGDVGAIVAWLKKIQSNNKRAIRQIVVIDATAAKRVNS